MHKTWIGFAGLSVGVTLLCILTLPRSAPSRHRALNGSHPVGSSLASRVPSIGQPTAAMPVRETNQAQVIFHPAHSLSHSPLTAPHAQNLLANLPLQFEANKGQTDKQVKFLSRGPGYTLFLTPTEAVMSLQRGGNGRVGERGNRGKSRTASAQHRQDLTPQPPSLIRSQACRAGGAKQYSSKTPSIHTTVLRMKLANANPAPTVRGVDETQAKSNYFIGSDPKQWRTNVAEYQKVRYGSVYPGIDLVYYGNGRQLEYDFVVNPGADPRKIDLDVQGADRLSVDRAGDLQVNAGGSAITWHCPTVYQEVNGMRKRVEGRYVVHSGRGATASRRVSFAVAEYDRKEPLTIDPVLAYSTYLGGSRYDIGYGIAVDSSGNAYVTGSTSANFPTTAGAYQTVNADSYDIFVTKIDTTKSGAATLVYSTYVGGSGGAYSKGIAVDNSGNAYVTGNTYAYQVTGISPYPTTAGAYQTNISGGLYDAFVTELNSTGTALLYSTYLGGSGDDDGQGIAVDGSGNAYVTGYTSSRDGTGNIPFPATAGAYRTENLGDYSAFVAKIDTTKSGKASLVYSTYLGGSEDRGYAIAVDGSGNAFVTGAAYCTDFPTTAGAYEAVFSGGMSSPASDAFVTKLNSTGTALLYSTYLGGSGNDVGYGIAVDSSGNAYVTGSTSSTNFPTAGTYQSASAGSTDAFVTKLNPTGTGLVYSTYLGGSSGDTGYAIAVDSSSSAYVTGYTQSTNFPTTPGAYQTANNGAVSGNGVAFVTKLNPTGTKLVYSTYLGGSSGDTGFAIAVDSSSSAYVTGYTQSTNFPTTFGAYQTVNNGGTDAFVTKLAFSPNWQAAAFVTGPDNLGHLLWQRYDGFVQLWNLAADGTTVSSYHNYGPFPGWRANSFAVGPDNLPHLLWQRSDGLAQVWNLAADGTTLLSYHNYGPFPGWTANSLAFGPDNLSHLLWQRSDGLQQVWNLAADGTSVPTYQNYGPYAGWTVPSLAVGPDNLTHLLWQRNDGLQQVWNLAADGTTLLSYHNFGPYAGWNANSLAVGPDNLTHLLWQRDDGLEQVWNLAADGTTLNSYQNFGPF